MQKYITVNARLSLPASASKIKTYAFHRFLQLSHKLICSNVVSFDHVRELRRLVLTILAKALPRHSLRCNTLDVAR
jgi:hypothetical protein